MDVSLEIRCFGQLTITQNGSPVSGLASRKAQALLVYLACTGYAHSRDVLANLLWDDRSQAQCMANLRVVLCSLRQQLGPFVSITPRTAQFNCLSCCSVDVIDLQNQLEAAAREPEMFGVLSPATAYQLARVLASYQGDFLSGFYLRDAQGFEEWMMLERERLHHQVVEGFHRLIKSYTYYQDFQAAIAHAKRLLDIDPFDEVARQELITLLAQTGQRNAAMAQYDFHRHMLAQELGIQPLKETVSLYEKVRTGQLTNLVQAPMRDNILTPFVGRTKEISDINSNLNLPSCRLVTLFGAAGVGKTRLALEVADYQVNCFEHGCFFISLASMSSGHFLTAKIAESLGFAFKNWGHPQRQLLDYLKDKQMLLIFDGFQQFVSEAGFVSDLLAHAPKLKVLVTSRLRLNLRNERMISIEGLARPQDQNDSEKSAFEAVELFVQRASRVQPGFSLDCKNRGDVLQICQLLKGIPLAIETAADQLATAPCSQIVAQIQSNPEFFLGSQQTGYNSHLRPGRLDHPQHANHSPLLQ